MFELHDEHKISYKTLLEPDLGIRASSNQTHIGLSERTLSFLPNCDKTIEDCIFIYEDSCELLDAHFGKIRTPKGTYRSPKIRTGDKNYISVVSVIRDIVKNHKSDRWFLLWFGLKNEKVVFFLFSEDSINYNYLCKLGLKLESGMRVLSDDEKINAIIKYLETKTGEKTTSIVEELKDLEVASQVEFQFSKQLQGYDIEKANRNFKEIGKQGEKLVDKFFSKKKKDGEISHYTWYNKNNESGLPYDFHIENVDGRIIYLDVKTTSYNFEQKMIFSNQEIKYISETDYGYCVYRVYKKDEQSFSLRICDDCKKISIEINTQTNNYKSKLQEIKTDLRSAKFAISPAIDDFKFDQEILLAG